MAGRSSAARCTTPCHRAASARRHRGNRAGRAGARTTLLARAARCAARARCAEATLARRLRLAKIVREHRVAAGNVSRVRGRPVKRQRDMHAGIDFRMMDRTAAGRRRAPSTSGKQRCERPAIAQHRQHPRRLRFHQAARELLPYALRRSVASSPDATIVRSSASVSGATDEAEARRKRARRAARAADPRRTPSRRGAARRRARSAAPP